MIILRNNKDFYLKENLYSAETALIKKYLPQARGVADKTGVVAAGGAVGLINRVVSPIKRANIRLRGILNKKSKGQIQRDLGAYDAIMAKRVRGRTASEAKNGYFAGPTDTEYQKLRANISGLNKATKGNRYDKKAAKEYRKRLKKNNNDSVLGLFEHGVIKPII